MQAKHPYIQNNKGNIVFVRMERNALHNYLLAAEITMGLGETMATFSRELAGKMLIFFYQLNILGIKHQCNVAFCI